MPVEIEAKFLNINRDDLRQRLQKAGYTCLQPDFLMRRVVYDLPQGNIHTWARVRDEGHAITVSYKRTHDMNSVSGTEEIVVTVDNFDAACDLLTAFGLIRKSYQETRREIWQRGAVEVTLDEWPALAPFTEFEAPDEPTIKAAAAELGFDWNDALFGAVGAVYEQLGISHKYINQFPRLTFENAHELLAMAGKV